MVNFLAKRKPLLSLLLLQWRLFVSQTVQIPTHTSQDMASNSKQKLNRKEVAELIVDPHSDGDFSDCGQADRSV